MSQYDNNEEAINVHGTLLKTGLYSEKLASKMRQGGPTEGESRVETIITGEEDATKLAQTHDSGDEKRL